MKNLINIFFKYLLILIILFTFFFISNLIFHVVPLLKIVSGRQQLNNIIIEFAVPSFYHSFFNSLIISIFLYGVMVFNYQKTLRILAFFIPIIIVTFLTFFILSKYKPTYNDLNFNRINDARIYFTEKNFIKENNYIFYFNKIEKNKINKTIMINGNNISFYDNCNIIFYDDKIHLNLQSPSQQTKIIEFSRDKFKSYNLSKRSIENDNYINLFNNLSYKLLYSQNISYNTFLIFSIAFLILSFSSVIKISNYPLLSLFFNILIMIFFYNIFIRYFDKFNKLINDTFSSTSQENILICFILLIAGIFFQIINFLFKKSHEWEIE